MRWVSYFNTTQSENLVSVEYCFGGKAVCALKSLPVDNVDSAYELVTSQVVEAASAAQLRQWARDGVSSKLQRAVLAGQGRRLLQQALPLSSHLPALVAKCEALHKAVEKGSLLELQELLNSDYNRKKYVMCRDEAGVGLLHKAIYYGFIDIATYLVKNYPELVHQRDSEGRTPLHYAAACRDEAVAAALLEGAGAARGARDAAGRTPAHYRGPARTLLALPASEDMPPDPAKNPPGLVIKRHNIRIWCHDCDMAKLQRVVWEGHGARLLSEVSNQPVVKKFLEAVPYIMNTIRDIHNAVVQNDLEGLIKLSGEPVPAQILSSRDGNNMTVTHKAAGLGHGGILRYIADRYPHGINDVDNDGRTPLHYAAVVRDDQHMYNTLVTLGADEGAVDNKNRTPGYYVNRPQEIDKSVFSTLPDAPRTPSSAYPASWDWKLLDAEPIVEHTKKPRKKNFKASSENISSKNNSNSISENISTRRGMKNSSTQELIKTLPELDDKRHNGNHYSNKDTEVDEENDIEKGDVQKADDHEEHVEETTENEEDNTENTEDVEDTKQEEDGDKEGVEHDDDDIHNESETNDEENEEHKTIEPDTEQSPEDNQVETEDDEKHDDPKEDISNEHEKDDEDSIPDNESDGHNDHHDTNEEAGNDSHDEDSTDGHENKNEEDESGVATTEGNINHEHNEDDDDVQVPGDSHSEYSDIHQRSTAEAIDTASAKRGNETDGRNTQESLIEGIISGEAEQDSEDASISQRDETVQGEILVVDSEIDPEVAELISSANMEMLATLVLNGEGSRLVGRRAANAELQSFLDNVPTYMQKINKVHLAAREGNIRDLQAALDRRKFAIARDPISPNGATPLHIATVFGKTNIMKYLGGRFPETLSAVDFEGRTALHYAAVLPDNGHYYNLLQQLGANSKDLDDNGRSAEDYFKDPSLLPYSQLLSDFGIDEEAAQSILSDKGTSDETNGHMDIPIFKTDEGRYLAKSLGDPLIKGLTEVANVKPKDPVAFLASFLQNFPDHEKPRLGTQESNVVVTREAGEVENDHPPPEPPLASKPAELSKAVRSAARTSTRPHRPIDVIAVDPQPEASPDAPEAAFSSINRDEHGQSMLHFAAARTHTRNALFQLLQESDISLGYRDELYRTAHDVSIQANVLENTAEIDRWVLHLAARGNTEKIMQLLLEGYDHILDVVDEDGAAITDVIAQRGDNDMTNLLASIPAFEEQREALHGAIRRGDLKAVQEAISAEGGRTLARGMNAFGRTALHVAVLAQHEEIVADLAQTCPELLRIGDNLERTPLHYAMGVEKMESLSRILIRSGAKRVLKDLKGRQPSYYFMNKSDILRLKEEEEVY
ncbi:uncharacterized protein LOC126372085 [Pectinophora gossypiella]|uniref:uncharacterized protein LOC126372085 n=1 Tax=Pectinophora gossypiella TaxID=13191 RepID=UPI00214E2A7B|nr:uncharacterized protein LOC126372085 [Pectinophora gossypiella]